MFTVKKHLVTKQLTAARAKESLYVPGDLHKI